MTKATSLNRRAAVILAADTGIATFAFVAAVGLRMDGRAALQILMHAPWTPVLTALSALLTFRCLRTYRRSWRFLSAADAVKLAWASGLAILLFTTLASLTGEMRFLPRSIPIIQWPLQLVLLCAARLARRGLADYLRGALLPPRPILPGRRELPRALLMGSLERVEMVLRRADRQSLKIEPVGILLDRSAAPLELRGVAVLGRWAELRQIVERLDQQGRRPQLLFCAEPIERLQRASVAPILEEAARLGLELAYLPQPAQLDAHPHEPLKVQRLDPGRLLDRPQAKLPTDMVAAALHDRRILVTGAGGTIGRELARQIASFGPRELLLLDASEFNLYEIELELREACPGARLIPLLCCIRQRAQLARLFARHKPEIVFHAAALKHVPLVETHASAGVLTNVIGTRNVADAARRCGSRAMIQVSSDKAVNPVGLMGVTKRLGELYCQALDLDGARSPGAPRFMTVRFGNVLGSSGSLIPLFQRQLLRGGPLTVTHPDIERFFMTVNEAVQLVLHAAVSGLAEGAKRGRIFVLDMGEPVRVIDLARRMIRLAGLRPEADVKIDIIGLRPGEKLFEELFDTSEERLPSTLPGILEASSHPLPLKMLGSAFDALARAGRRGDDLACRRLAIELLASQARGVDGAVPNKPAPVETMAVAP